MHEPKPHVFPDLSSFVGEVQLEVDLIPAGRRAELEQLARFIRRRTGAGETARLVFICTHNSRRSHLAQVWCQTAARMHGLSRVETYSGGTEATAFDPRAVASLERAGFRVRAADAVPNPRYLVRFSDEVEPMVCFSKVYDQPPNPREGFCAIMTCSAADEGCPVVLGASERIALRYDDPKEFDGTPLEAQKYDERCRQIAREMFAALSHAVE
jgi:arsenate reductase